MDTAMSENDDENNNENDDEEFDDYEYDYSDDDENDNNNNNDNGENDSCDEGSSSSANPNAPPSAGKNNNSSTTMTWVAQRNPAAVKLMPAEDLVPEMKLRLKDAVEALGVPLSAAAPLLRQHSWSVQSLLQSYYGNPQGVLAKAGVLQRCRRSGDEIDNDNTDTDDNTNNVSSIATRTRKKQATITSTIPTTIKPKTTTNECFICMDTLEDADDTKLAMNCGHEFCLECWGDFLTNVVGDEGAACVLATCPQSNCTEVVTEEEVAAAAPHLLMKFQHYQLRSFVDSNDLARWCPGKGCEQVAHATHHKHFRYLDDHDKIADCGACQTSFCIACGSEPHIPVACALLIEWDEKNSNESETANWITANTKSCPKCATRIHKDGGCQYVTCRKCRHGFCWVCLGTHHVWNCNVYKGDDDDQDKTRAKNELERYLHYYQRYHGHAVSQKFAKKQLKKMEKEEDAGNASPAARAVLGTNGSSTTTKTTTTTAAKMGDTNGTNPGTKEVKDAATPTTGAATGATTATNKSKEIADVIARNNSRDGGDCDLRFLKDANLQLVKCRRVLKYTYVFAYYKFTNPALKREKECFEHHQGILEGLTEDLSKVTETKDVREIDQTDVINRTRVIGQFIKNVLEYVDSGMVE